MGIFKMMVIINKCFIIIFGKFEKKKKRKKKRTNIYDIKIPKDFSVDKYIIFKAYQVKYFLNKVRII